MSDAELEAIRARDAAFTNDAPLGDWRHHEPGGGLHIASFCAADCVNDRRVLLARLDAAEARKRALREAVDLAYRWVNFTPEGADGLRSWMRRALFAEPTEDEA